MLYIDNGKTVKSFETSSKIEKAIITLLVQDENLQGFETLDGYEVKIVEKGADR